ncbi:hypothetical protein ACQPW3_24420 [Actinosynnema sp. CA-248983]
MLLTSVLISPASACVCFPGNEALCYQQATYVFSGVVVAKKVEQNNGYDLAVLRHDDHHGDHHAVRDGHPVTLS